MIIIAGLGNPGRKYEKTRHNCGFEALDILADRYKIRANQGTFRSLCGTGVIDGVSVRLMKPLPSSFIFSGSFNKVREVQPASISQLCPLVAVEKRKRERFMGCWFEISRMYSPCSCRLSGRAKVIVLSMSCQLP